MKVICIGSAVIDIMAHPVGDSGQWKEKQRISDIRIQTGGDAANQSIHLASLGWESALAACIGDDTNGKMLRAALERRGVDTCLMTERENCATGTAMVLVNEEGERRIFSVKGAHSTLSGGDLRRVLPAFPDSCRAISLASLFSMPVLEGEGLLEYLWEARERGIPVFADLAADKLGLGLKGIVRFLPYIDYFLPSRYDVLEMTGTDRVREAAKRFRELGVSHVIIKCGARGCYCSASEFEGWIPAVPVQPVDTTGAGDCMSAVFLAGILEGRSVEDACRYACAAASYSTLFFGASQVELTDRKIMDFLEEYQK